MFGKWTGTQLEKTHEKSWDEQSFPHFIIYFNYYHFWCVVHVKMADGKRPLLDEKPEEQGEDKSAKAIRMLREVTMLLGETTNNQPGGRQEVPIAQGQVGASNILQNFRTIFAPYNRPPLAPLSSSVQTKRNTVKPKFFKIKETWTHDFFCLAAKDEEGVPSRAEKFDLQHCGLGRRKVCFHSKATFTDFRRKLEEEYPKLKEGGGFELMRTGHQGSNTVLTTIIPPPSGYSVPFLRDSSGLGQALAYIRPLQRDLDRTPVFKVSFSSFFCLVFARCVA